jgi:hypothetical protein
MPYHATKSKVLNRGVPPNSFLDQLVAWGRTAADDIFAPNSHHDVYSSVVGVLGPWAGMHHRRAVMLEVMRVLAGFESSWTWNEGSDVSADRQAAKHHKVRPPSAIEAGAWQVSADSMALGPELKALVLKKLGSTSATDFQRGMKQDHQLAMEYIARLLRRTVNHNGPVKRHEIDNWVRKDAVTEFQSLLYPVTPLQIDWQGNIDQNPLHRQWQY